MSADIPTDSAKIVYDEAVKAHDAVLPLLTQYRTNTIQTLGIVTVAASLLGFGSSASGPLVWLSLLSYMATVGVAVAIYNPVPLRTNIAKGSADKLAESANQGRPAPAAKIYQELATSYDKATEENQEVLDGRLGTVNMFRAALFLSGLTIALMLASVANESDDGHSEPLTVIIEEEE